MSLAVGDMAPDFTLPASGGRAVRLGTLRGHPCVLYFYPRADTPGCTLEACGFQEALAALGASGLSVIGVSKDKIGQIEAFAAKYHLTFPLASDAGTTVAEAYGAWGEKSMYGKTYMGMLRMSFLIDGAGRIARIWPRVKVAGHAAEVAAAARAMAAEGA